MSQGSHCPGSRRAAAEKFSIALSSEGGSRYLSQSRRHTWPSPKRPAASCGASCDTFSNRVRALFRNPHR